MQPISFTEDSESSVSTFSRNGISFAQQLKARLTMNQRGTLKRRVQAIDWFPVLEEDTPWKQELHFSGTQWTYAMQTLQWNYAVAGF